MSDLGRRIPTTWEHVEKYPLLATTVPDEPMPVIFGTNWYEAFDRPEYDRSERRWWVGRNANLGRIRGGHAYAGKPDGVRDYHGWWDYYDQGTEGACVGTAASRAMTWTDRVRFDWHWLYREAQLVDSWAETPPEEGTSVRAAIDILRTKGHRRTWSTHTYDTDPKHGVSVNRWAQSMEDVYAVLKSPRLEAQGVVAFANSWGRLRDGGRRGYPKLVYMPAEVMARLLNEYGEATMFTPR